MADQLATPQDLASLLQLDWASLSATEQATMTLLVECATAVVQATCGGQRIVQVIDDEVAIEGITDSWLALPQLPVAAVSSVVLDGVTLDTAANDYKVVGNRLWRRLGWQTNWGWPIDWPYPVWGVNGTPFNWQGMLSEPSVVIVTYTHGYATGAQELQLARQATLALAAGVYSNPDSATQMRIDDYSATYDAMASKMETSSHMRAALRRQYGRRAGLVRIG